MHKNTIATMTAAAAMLIATLTAFPQKASDIVAKHLESIGTSANRSALKDMTAAGTVRFAVLRTGGIGADGKIVVASSGDKTLTGMTFPLQNYPNDTFIFDGKKLKIAFPVINTRSPLGDFLFRYSEIVDRGLFGGTLTSGWAMYSPDFRKARLEYDGIKKVDNKEAHAVSFLPRGGSDVDIRMFFDVQTFRLIRTEYKRMISASQGGSPETSSGKRGQRQIMTEDFGDYRNESGLMLPHSYKVYLLLDGETETNEFEWKATFTNFFFNQQLDPSTFNTGGK